MKVDELIETLRKLPPDATLMVATNCCGCAGRLEAVRLIAGDEKLVFLEDRAA